MLFCVKLLYSHASFCLKCVSSLLHQDAKRVLNEGGCDDTPPLPVEELSVTLQRAMLCMRGQHMVEDGSGVNYSELARSQEFQDYCRTAAGLADVDLSCCSQQQKKAFFISIHLPHPLIRMLECQVPMKVKGLFLGMGHTLLVMYEEL